MRQLALDIGPPAEPAFDNYVAGPNAEALERVRSLAAGGLGEAIVYLWGEPGSGRTHLLQAGGRQQPGEAVVLGAWDARGPGAEARPQGRDLMRQNAESGEA